MDRFPTVRLGIRGGKLPQLCLLTNSQIYQLLLIVFHHYTTSWRWKARRLIKGRTRWISSKCWQITKFILRQSLSTLSCRLSICKRVGLFISGSCLSLKKSHAHWGGADPVEGGGFQTIPSRIGRCHVSTKLAWVNDFNLKSVILCNWPVPVTKLIMW